MSHLDGQGNTQRGTGFWGIRKNCMPVEDKMVPPAWLRRSGKGGSLRGQVGTTISILGFSAKSNWQDNLAANITENFFGSISTGRLEVTIENGPLINKETLSSLFQNTDIRRSVDEQKGEPKKFINASHYFRALSEEINVKTAETQNLHLGKCQIRILLEEGLPKKVAFLRNGMLITDELAGLKRFGPYKDFVAVLECHNQKGLRLLRAMEPPRHDDFEPERLSPEKRSQGKIALREITNWVRETLERFAKDPVSAVTTLDELANYFEDEDQNGPDKIKEENPDGLLVIRQRPIKIKFRLADINISAELETSADLEEELEEEPNLEDTRQGDLESTTDETGAVSRSRSENKKEERAMTGEKKPGPTSQAKQTASFGIPLENVRAVLLDPLRRRVSFTAGKTGLLDLELQNSGADTNHRLKVSKSSKGSVENGLIRSLHVVAGERCCTEIELEHSFEGTLRVVAHAV